MLLLEGEMCGKYFCLELCLNKALQISHADHRPQDIHFTTNMSLYHETDITKGVWGSFSSLLC